MNKYKDEDRDTPRPRVYNLKKTVKVIVSDTVLDQIKYLCNKIHRVEWSGVIFYDTEGDIHDIDNFIITLKYIYLMHKGSGGATDYMFSEELVGFRMDNAPEALKWKIGHIHSHHSMQAYFSGTDEDEMKLNSEFHNYYLSVIVNNRMEIVGRVGFRGEIQETVYTCVRGDGELYKLNANTKQLTMFQYNADISTSIDDSVEKSFKERLDTIKERKADEEKQATKLQEIEDKRKSLPNGFDKFPVRKEIPQSPMERKLLEESNQMMKDYNEEMMYNAGFEIEDEFDETQFPSFWVLAGELGAEEVDFDDALEQLNVKLITEADELEHVTMVLNIATELYSRYFIGIPYFNIVDMFMDIHAELEQRAAMFNFVPMMLQGLEAYIMELKDVKEEVNGS